MHSAPPVSCRAAVLCHLHACRARSGAAAAGPGRAACLFPAGAGQQPAARLLQQHVSHWLQVRGLLHACRMAPWPEAAQHTQRVPGMVLAASAAAWQAQLHCTSCRLACTGTWSWLCRCLPARAMLCIPALEPGRHREGTLSSRPALPKACLYKSWRLHTLALHESPANQTLAVQGTCPQTLQTL